MKFTKSIKFSSEGAPMLIGDVENAQYWNGTKDDGSGVRVEYWCLDMAKLPDKFLKEDKINTNSRGRKKRFKTTDEAEIFEKALLRHFIKFYPNASRPPQYPDYPVWYEGDYMNDKKVFGIDRKFNSMYKTMLKKLKGDVGKIIFDKQHKASALFFEMEPGPGIVAVDNKINAFVVAVITAVANKDTRLKKIEPLLGQLGQTSLDKLKAKGNINLSGNVVAFDSALASPNKALFTIKPGAYNYCVVRDGEAKNFSYNSLWVWLK